IRPGCCPRASPAARWSSCRGGAAAAPAACRRRCLRWFGPWTLDCLIDALLYRPQKPRHAGGVLERGTPRAYFFAFSSAADLLSFSLAFAALFFAFSSFAF